MKKKQRLALRQAIYALLISLFVGAIVTLVQLNYDLQSEKKYTSSMINKVTRILSSPAARAILEVDLTLAKTVIEGLISYPPIYSATLIDYYGTQLYSQTRPPTHYPLEWLVTELFGANKSYDITIRYQNDRQPLGQIKIKIDHGVLAQNFINRAKTTIISHLIGNFILALFLFLFFYYWLTRPVSRITQEIASINHQQPKEYLINAPSFHQHNELGHMVNVINKLLVDFDTSLQQLAEHQHQLEAQVIARTADLQAAKQEAEQANQDKSRFLAAASHDLRQPLQAVNLFVGALSVHLKEPQALALHQQLVASLEDLHSLFNALMDISKLDAGTYQAQLMEFPLQPLLHRLALRFSVQAQTKLLRLNVRYPDCWVLSDQTLLERLLSNLISNAIKYTEQGGVLIGCRYYHHKIRIDIYDTGFGMTQAEQETMFQEFVQFNNPARVRENGLGLGLAIVYRLSHLLEHPLSWRSKLNQGSRFSIELPLVKAPEKPVETRLPILMENQLLDKTVLIIDNEQSIIDSMKILFEQWGMTVFSATRSDQALEYTEQPDIIISDYRLNDKENGVLLVEKLWQQYQQQVPAIIISGDSQIINPEKLPILHKPILPSQLRTLINRLLM